MHLIGGMEVSLIMSNFDLKIFTSLHTIISCAPRNRIIQCARLMSLDLEPEINFLHSVAELEIQ